MEKLLYPLQYFRLRNVELRFIDYVPTALLAALIFVPFALLPGSNFFGAGGFLSSLSVLTAALTGFYVAALTAAATFAHPDLDKVMVYGAVKRKIKLDDGNTDLQPLTRREFVCLVFGFLAFSAMLFTIFGGAVLALVPAMPKALTIVGYDIFMWGKLGALALFSIWVAHLFSVTCLGLYYLMERLHRKDKRIITRASDKEAA